MASPAVEVYKNYQQYLGELTLDRPDSPPCKGPTIRASKLPIKMASTPAKKTSAVVTAKYKVRNGDTLSDIAQRFGMPVRNLMNKNKLNKPVIYAGQILLVKQSAHNNRRRSGHNAIWTPFINQL